jgi:hypothetical protein
MHSIKKTKRRASTLLIVSNIVLLGTSLFFGVMWQKDRAQQAADRAAQEKISTLLGIPALDRVPDRCATKDNSDLLLVPVNPLPVEGYSFYAGVCKWKDSTEPPILYTFETDSMGIKHLVLNNGTSEPWCLNKSLEGDLAMASKATGIPLCTLVN